MKTDKGLKSIISIIASEEQSNQALVVALAAAPALLPPPPLLMLLLPLFRLNPLEQQLLQSQRHSLLLLLSLIASFAIEIIHLSPMAGVVWS